ncbi:MAG: DUF2089 family protein [Planctomycetaceae bacterium]|nr:DUF2089 family protein [Planctomycetaceae bacterium]
MAKKAQTSECPYCGLTMQTAAMHCPACQVRVEGVFAESLLGRLSPEDQQFLLEFLLSNFSIKALEENSKFGYAAIRSRLDKLVHPVNE